MPATAAVRFEPYGASHLAALAVLVLGVVVLVLLGRRHRRTPAARRVGRRLAGAVLVVTVPLQVWYFTPGSFDLAKTLPLQLCDLASLVAAHALWTGRRWSAALTYYWGLTLTTQAIITPDLAAAFPDPVFLLYWAMHVVVVWAAVHLAWGLGLAPAWREYRTALAVTVAWAVAVFGFNVVVGTNYGYLNAKPSAPSVLDLLGPWPWYLAAEAGLVAAVWALVTWPWVARPLTEARSSGPRPGRGRTAPP